MTGTDEDGHALLNQLFSIPLDEDKYIVYAPLKKIAFIANPQMVNAIADRCSGESGPPPVERAGPAPGASGVSRGTDWIDYLSKAGFFRPEPLPSDEFDDGIRYDTVVLFLTNECNLRCLYCYASSGDHPVVRMNWDTARSAIDFVAREVVRHEAPVMTLGFHGGGEPTLNWDVLKRSVTYARHLADRHGFRLEVSGAFNGFWSSKTLAFIRAHFTELSLSFDGLPAIQDEQRPTQAGKSSSARVMRTLESLDEAGLRYGIRMTVTSRSVDRLADSVRFICERFRPLRIQVEPVFFEGRARANRVKAPAPDVFVERFLEGRREALKHGTEIFYSGARLEAITSRFCLAACRALVVTPEGNVTACFEVFGRAHPLSSRFLVGHYEGDGRFSMDSQGLNRHLNQTVSGIPWCEACFCKWHCAGDCEAKMGTAPGAPGRSGSLRCRVTQELITNLILEKIVESSGGVWMGDPATARAQ